MGMGDGGVIRARGVIAARLALVLLAALGASVLGLSVPRIGVRLARAQSFGYAHGFGSPLLERGRAIAVDASGNTYLTGSFQGTVDFDPGSGAVNFTTNGNSDVFVLKLDPNGNLVWAHAFGNTGRDDGRGIAVDSSNNVYVTGSFEGTVNFSTSGGATNLTSHGLEDVFALKLDGAGNLVWAREVGGSDIDQGLGIAADASGAVLVTGFFGDTVDFNPNGGTFNLSSAGIGDAFLLKLDTDGGFMGVRSFGGTSEDEGFGIALDGSGNVYLTGFFSGTTDFDPGPGTLTLTSSGASSDIFVLKLTPVGTLVWVHGFGNTGVDIGEGITTDGTGTVYLTGLFQGTVDFDPGLGTANLTGNNKVVEGGAFALALDTNGNFVWAHSLVGAGPDEGTSIAIDRSGDLYLTGRFGGTASVDPGLGSVSLTSGGFSDIFMMKLDPGGSLVWLQSLGSTSVDEGLGVAVDGIGDVYLTGLFEGTLDADPGPASVNLASAGLDDAFVVKLVQAAPPVNGLPAAQTTPEDTALVLSTANGNKISIADADNGASPLRVRLTATNGVLTLPGTTGLTFSEGDGTADPSVTFAGTLAAINTALDGLSYTPATNVNGGASLQIATFDQFGPGGGQSDADSLAIAISPVDDAPTATADSFSTGSTGALNVPAPGLLANDADIDSPSLTAVKVSDPAHGSLTLNADGSFSYSSAAGFAGTDTFTYQASDGTVASTPATVTIAVTAPPPTNPVPNRPPTAAPDTFTVEAGAPLTVTAAGVLANDTDPDAGTTLQAQLVSGPAHGTLALSPDGGFVYSPNADFAGTDSFTYQASDGITAGNPATVIIAVTPLRCAPRPRVQTRPTAGGGALQVHVEATAHSTGENNPLLRIDFGQLQNARVTLNGQPITSGQSFTPPAQANAHGVDFAVERVTPGQPVMVPFTVLDDCGTWPTFVGGGTAAGF